MPSGARSHRTTRRRYLLAHLPESPGVYLFFGAAGELLYVGKSTTIRSRVRAHFTEPEERRRCARVASIDYRRTAGELGALLLESQLIKELRPLWNVRQRQRRRIIVARGTTTPRGYNTVSLEAVDRIDPADPLPVLSMFRTYRQAAEHLAAMARTHRLCPKLLGLERSRTHCFSYHLHWCGGACMGEEDPPSYNHRFAEAFEERRIKSWPFDGAVIIEERSEKHGEREVFVVDRWCLLYSFAYAEDRYRLGVQGRHRFDYDSYRILAGYIFSPGHAQDIRPASRTDIASLLKAARAA